ncbi:MAG TPA: histidine phosphatase family protein, partial [Acidimicrobiales bacterium]|nr:histidine phosphatase family protein [Acidimicrobiales bacterium]
SPLGEEQAEEAAAHLAGAGITGVVTSDLVRARRTGEIVADVLGLGAAVVCPGLREYDVGQWSGLTKPEIEDRWPGQQLEWFQGRLATTPGGEGRVHFARRVMDAVLGVGAAAAPGAVLVVVTHGGVIRVLERATGASPVPIANLSGRWFELADGDPTGGDPADEGTADPAAGDARRVDGATLRLRAGEPLSLVGPDHRTASPSA